MFQSTKHSTIVYLPVEVWAKGFLHDGMNLCRVTEVKEKFWTLFIFYLFIYLALANVKSG